MGRTVRLPAGAVVATADALASSARTTPRAARIVGAADAERRRGG
jgi:hypothetical protein